MYNVLVRISSKVYEYNGNDKDEIGPYKIPFLAPLVQALPEEKRKETLQKYFSEITEIKHNTFVIDGEEKKLSEVILYVLDCKSPTILIGVKGKAYNIDLPGITTPDFLYPALAHTLSQDDHRLEKDAILKKFKEIPFYLTDDGLFFEIDNKKYKGTKIVSYISNEEEE
jgi:hypothetical protein